MEPSWKITGAPSREPAEPGLLGCGTETLGEDLVLLALIPYQGIVKYRSDLGIGLMGAELAALAQAGRIDAASGRVVLTGPAGLTAGDPDLDSALAALAAAGPPRPVSWVGRPRRGIVDSYLSRLTAAGVVSRQGRWPLAKWPIMDGPRASAVRARMDALALGPEQASTAQGDPAQLALAGLVHATGLSKQLYSGWGNRAARGRLREVASGQWIADAVFRAVDKARAAAGA